MGRGGLAGREEENDSSRRRASFFCCSAFHSRDFSIQPIKKVGWDTQTIENLE
jgi:hypothetical protein